MWTEAAKAIAKFNDAVLTVADADGYPVSVRVPTAGYDATTGELSAVLPAELRAVEGPADLLCHFHNEKLWGIQLAHVKGRLVQRGNGLVFVSTAFTPPPKVEMLAFIRKLSGSAQKYLDHRGLPRPDVNWTAIKEIRGRAQHSRRT